MNNFENLNRIQIQFNEFMLLVNKETGLTDDDFNNLGFVETAKLITEPKLQKKYCQLACKLLEENIRALQTNDEEEYTSEWAETLLMWCKDREQLKQV